MFVVLLEMPAIVVGILLARDMVLMGGGLLIGWADGSASLGLSIGGTALLATLADRFHLLKYGLAMVLTFIGAKMLIMPWYHVPVAASLAIVAALIGASVVASLIATRGKSTT